MSFIELDVDQPRQSTRAHREFVITQYIPVLRAQHFEALVSSKAPRCVLEQYKWVPRKQIGAQAQPTLIQ